MLTVTIHHPNGEIATEVLSSDDPRCWGDGALASARRRLMALGPDGLMAEMLVGLSDYSYPSAVHCTQTDTPARVGYWVARLRDHREESFAHC
jgi:hypothetical protein